MLSPEQNYAFERFKEGKNLFITGPGGTGKTRLIETLVNYMTEKDMKYQVCALTGCATVLLNKCKARTIHSWSGIGLANGPKEKIVNKVVKSRHTVKGWKKVKVLIVDEVSMMSKKIFEILDYIGRVIKKVPQPFGGIQVVFTGDFYQLPPVGNYEDEDTCKFCFESELWTQVFPKQNHIQLTTIFRQTDSEYREILNQIRCGSLESRFIELLKSYVGRPKDELITPAKLFAVRAKADFVNQSQYVKLEGEEIIYKTESSCRLVTYMDSGKAIESEKIAYCSSLDSEFIQNELDYLANSSNRIPLLKLKVGAHVMCLHNLDIEAGICNGTQGIIKSFTTNTLGQRIPIVLFSNGITMQIDMNWIQSDEYPCLGISQIPLCLSWALTIHKIQGATLPMAEMDLGNTVFEFGQTYVALSRIERLTGLYLSAFQPNKIKANPIVKEFYAGIPVTDYAAIIIPDITSMTASDEAPANIFGRFIYTEREEKAVLLEEEEYISEGIIEDPSVMTSSVKVIQL
jgi:ATP-dependent DNA helicase PIF1